MKYTAHDLSMRALDGVMLMAISKVYGTLMTVSLTGDRVHVSMSYIPMGRPFVLMARANKGDEVLLRFCKSITDETDFRVELYVNGALCDEEWPYGALDWDTLEGNFTERVYEYTEAYVPTVIKEFENIEGWRPDEGVYVGDCMPYTDCGRYHVLYLKDRHRHSSKHGLGAHQWEHISTSDMKVWQVHPMAVPITSASEGSICTGSYIRVGDKHFLWYTVRSCDRSPAPIKRSVSDDGYHFEKDESFGFSLSDRYTAHTARDPKVFLGADGLYHMLLTTTLRYEGKGCLAHLVSEDMESFRELEPIYISPDEDEPECSDYFELSGRYYLVFSHRGRGQYRYSEFPFDGWQTPTAPEIPCQSVPKAAIFGGELIFAGFSGDGRYAGTMTLKRARADADGTLIFY